MVTTTRMSHPVPRFFDRMPERLCGSRCCGLCSMNTSRTVRMPFAPGMQQASRRLHQQLNRRQHPDQNRQKFCSEIEHSNHQAKENSARSDQTRVSYATRVLIGKSKCKKFQSGTERSGRYAQFRHSPRAAPLSGPEALEIAVAEPPESSNCCWLLPSLELSHRSLVADCTNCSCGVLVA